MKLTATQKAQRLAARRAGRKALLFLTNALFPVYEDDFTFWLDAAVRRAREAWRYALNSKA